MALQPRKLGVASATTAALLYMLCWNFVALLPGLSLQLTEDMLHGTMGAMSWRMDARSLLVGTILWAALAGAAVWTAAALYNRFDDSPPENGDETSR